MDVSIVIVNWNVQALLQRCLSSITTACAGLQCEVIVVDSASTDGSVEMVRQLFPTTRVISCNTNVGFTRGNNLGIAQGTGHYILLLNPDTEVQGDALHIMVSYLDQHPDIGALGPRLTFPDGRIQSSRRRFPTLATTFLESTLLQQWFPRNRFLARYYVQDRSAGEEQDVDWLVGACLLLRRQAWEQIGPLDESFFMYSEELDWCQRAKAVGWRVVYLPAATVIHYEGQSSAQVVPARHIYFQSSKVRYVRKYHGIVASETLRLFLLATYALQVGEESAKWLVGHKRALRRSRIRAYLRVLRSGLQVRGEVRS
jgi:N-acetylglucosaminyl-diphospho-decaprenol L-rhamnosyltransferase